MDWLLELVGKHEWIGNALMIVGSMRLVLKPIFSMLNTYVNTTASKSDNEWLGKVESNSIVKAILYALDWVASIKVKS